MPGLNGQSHAQQFCRDPSEMPTRKAAERQQGVGCGTGNTGDLRQEEIWGGLGGGVESTLLQLSAGSAAPTSLL